MGTSSVEIPEAFDGNDLQIHLMYHFTLIDNSVDEPTDNSEQDDKDDSLPSISAITSIMVVLFAAMTRKS